MRYFYNVLGQLTSAVKGVDAAQTTTTLSYDAAGRKTAMTDPDMGAWQYDYDALGNLKKQTDARGCVSTLSYDALNRLTQKSYSGGPSDCAATSKVIYRYDEATVSPFAKGHRTSMVDGSGSTSWIYDNRGRTLSETKIIDTKSFTTRWEYNNADMPISMTYPGPDANNPEKLVYTYDNAGNLLKLSNSAVVPEIFAQGMQYDEALRQTQLTLGGNINRTFNYAAWSTTRIGGLLQNITTKVGSAAPIQSFAYDYDENGNVKSINNQIIAEMSSFTYDTLNRLTNAQTSVSNVVTYTEAFDYDPANGNLLHKGPNLYTYSASHPHAVAKVGATQQYGYDSNGNMTQRLDRAMHYDAENRLIAVATASATLTAIASTTKTKTKTVTAGKTNTQTPSKTFTITPTKTKTSPSTVTLTRTLPPVTATSTLTATPTATMTAASPQGETPTLSASTATSSHTPTGTATITETGTVTETPDPLNTSTQTVTASPSGIPNASATLTTTATSNTTSTRTITATISKTPTITKTATVTKTRTRTLRDCLISLFNHR